MSYLFDFPWSKDVFEDKISERNGQNENEWEG